MSIRLQGVRFAYPRTGEPSAGASEVPPLFDDLSLTIHPGEFVAILGPNGSGKSTLARMAAGLLRPAAGEVLVDDINLYDPASAVEARRRVGIVFQDPDAQIIATIVEEDVAFGLENRGVPREEMRRRVEEALRAVGLGAHRKRPPHQLSGGQKQRLAIAGWLAVAPRYLILDEATAMLDVEGRAEVMALLTKLHRQGMTLVMVTHHMEEALAADRVLVMARGRMVLDGPPAEVFTHSRTLRELRLDVPAAVEVADRLRADGWDLPPVLTPADLASALARTARPTHGSGMEAGAGAPEGAPPREEASAEAPVLVSVRHVSHTYLRGTPLAQPALEDVSFELRSGETTAIVGHTGSGKSTLAQVLAALIVPERGEVVIGGVRVERSPSVLRRVRSLVGLVMQRPEAQLFEALVGDDVAYGPLQQGLSIDKARERVRFAMEAVGLDFAWRDRPVQALSGGERRKVAIAGVLAMMPRLLILDEPTAGLDPASRDELLARLRALASAHGMTLLLITHRMEEVAALADRVLALRAGKLVWDGPVRAWFADPERLAALGMGLPDAAQLAAACRAVGLPVRGVPLSRDEAYHAIRTALAQGRRADG